MATFAAGNTHSLNMNTIAELSVLSAASSDWTTALLAFAAVSADHTIEVSATGVFLAGPDGIPTSGTITGLSIQHGAAPAYTISGFSSDFTTTLSDIAGNGAHAALAHILAGDDAVDGSRFADLLHGFAGSDAINGWAGDDQLFGDGGDDVLTGGRGKDLLIGGAGYDTAVYINRNPAIAVTLNGAAAATVLVGGVAEDTLKSIEAVIGGNGADHLTGDSRANMLIGNRGNDVLAGRGGNDILVGGPGKDSLSGGAGHDDFYFNAPLAAGNVDTINGFAHRSDLIFLSQGIFSHLSLISTNFFAVGSPHDGTDYIVYDANTGKLSYDADASGPGGGVVFAQLGKHLALDGSDFLVTV